MSARFRSFLLACLMLAGCGRDEATPDPSPLVRTALIGRAASGGLTSYTGTVRSRIESDLGFRVSGKITERLVDPGAYVHRGQPLMRIDAADLTLAAGGSADRLRAAQADASRAAADEARLRGLVEAGAISASAYDAALAAKRSSAAGVSAARAAAGQAGNERGYATLIADADGVVLDVLAQPGQVVAAGTPVVRLGRAGPREALVAVPETALASLPRVGVATLYGQAGDFAARLREVAGAADPLTRTFAARYTLAGGDAAPLGTTVTVTLRAAGGAAQAVPLASLYDPGTGPGVWVVGRDRRVAFRRVSVAALQEEQAMLAPASLRTGERIVALGAQLLRPGEQVRIAATEDARP